MPGRVQVNRPKSFSWIGSKNWLNFEEISLKKIKSAPFKIRFCIFLSKKLQHLPILGFSVTTLQQYGIIIHDVGITYVADHVQANSDIAQSALDHVYSSSSMRNVQVKKLTNSSSDHVPVMVTYATKQAGVDFLTIYFEIDTLVSIA